MKYYTKNFFLIFLLFSIPLINVVHATHIIGGDITYRCLGGNQYEISLSVRRDCINGNPGAQFDDPAFLGIYDGSGNLRTELGNNGVLSMEFRPDDTLNEVINNNCGLVGGNICVHTTTYVDVITLPYRADGYILAYQRCCRNFTISNIINPLTVGSTFTVHIYPAALQVCNNSPLLNKWPPIYVCGDAPLDFNLLATDEDGDSLVYELCNPLTGADQAVPRPPTPSAPPYDPVIFKTPYSLTDVIGGSPALTIGRFNGRMKGFVQPNITQYLIAYCVKEYRHGVLLSELQREFQINVRTCVSNAISKFDFILNQCEDPVRISLNNLSTSPNSILKSTQWQFNLNGTNSTSNDFNKDLILSDSGTLIVKLIAESKEGCTDTTEKIIPYQSIKPEFLKDSFKICKGDQIQIIKNYKSGLLYQWTPGTGLSCADCPSPIANPLISTWYILKTDNVNCNRLDSVYIKVDPCIIDSCAVSIRESCLPGGSVELSVDDAFGNLLITKLREHELFWNLKASATQTAFSIINQNPIIVPAGTEYSLTSKIYTWKKGAPKTIENADICQRRINGKAKTDCTGPCKNIDFILSSCEDNYDIDNNLNFPSAICQSICKNDCQFIIALFEKNGNLINPSDYAIKWSTGSSGAYVMMMQPYYNQLTVEVRKGDCVWYGRYIRSCKNTFGSTTHSSNYESIIEKNTDQSFESRSSKNKIITSYFFKLSPNPFNESVFLSSSLLATNESIEIEVWNISGKLCSQQKNYFIPNSEIEIKKDKFGPSGIYFLKIKYMDRIEIIRLVKN